MRKQSKAFQSKRSGNRAVPALAHQIVNDKTWQLAASYGMMNLLRRFGTYWLPRNRNTDSDQQPSSQFARDVNEGKVGVGLEHGLISPRAISHYVRRGVHKEAV